MRALFPFRPLFRANKFQGIPRSISTLKRHLSSNPYAGSTNSILLPFEKAAYSSVEIKADTLPVSDSSEFGSRLFLTLKHLKEKENTQAVYLRVGILFSHFMPIATMYGFKLHHANVDTDEVVMLLWLGEGTSKVPPFATHHAGVGGLVLKGTGTDKEEILLVREKSKTTANWKLPGGYCMQGEEFGDCASREIFEETGIKAKFERLLTVRHSHKVQFGCVSDVYLICLMSLVNPVEHQITIDSEIEDACWMPLVEFREKNNHPMLEQALKVVNEGKGLEENVMESTLKNRPKFRLYSPI